MPEYGAISDPALLAEIRASCEQSIGLFTRWASGRLGSAHPELDFFRLHTARRAAQLFPLDALLQASRVALRVVWDWLVDRAQDDPQAALTLAEHLVRFTDASVVAGTQAYLAEQQALASGEDRARRDLVEDLLAGRFPLRQSASSTLAQMGFEPDAVCAVVVAGAGTASPPEGLGTAAAALSRSLRSGRRQPLVAVRHDEVVAVLVVDGAAATVRARVEEARRLLGAVHQVELLAGISTPCQGLEEVQRGYEEAHRALRIARATGRPVVALQELGMLEYLASLADATARRIVPPEVHRLLEEDARLDGILRRTLQAYLESGLNVGRAARTLVVHPNTVHYRLRRVAEITGRNMRQPLELVDLLWAARVAGELPPA